MSRRDAGAFYEGCGMVSEEERYEEKRRLSWEFDVEEEEFEEKGNEDFLIWAVGIRSPASPNEQPTSSLIEWNSNLSQPSDPEFDFVHIRYSPSLLSSPTLIPAAFSRTKPGGWIEIVDPASSSPSSCASSTYSNPKETTCERKSKVSNAQAISRIRKLLLEAGFVDVEAKSLGKERRGWEQLKRVVLGWIWGQKGSRREEAESRGGIFVIARRPC